MPSTTTYELGEIVLVSFPFTDQVGRKQRPALVVSSQAYNQARPDLILMAVTSQVRARRGFGEVVIDDWQAGGLLKPSAIKPVIFTMEKNLIRKKLGRLKKKDQNAIKNAIAEIIQ